jgi:uncharacterized protein (DUF1697 family)
MKYVALLRGINVGGNHTVKMDKLKKLFESADCSNVSTYINSGNVLFETKLKKREICERLETIFKENFDFDIPTLVKTTREMSAISKSIPSEWKNDNVEKSDIAYLFPEIDNAKILDELPVKKQFVDIRYVKGAVFWNVKRKNYNKSNLNKIISSKCYKYMTVRNINTARVVGKW